MGILVPQPGIKPAPPALEVWSLNHWTTREVPSVSLKLFQNNELKVCIEHIFLEQESVAFIRFQMGEEPLFWGPRDEDKLDPRGLVSAETNETWSRVPSP